MTAEHNKAHRQGCSEDKPDGPPKCGPKRRRGDHSNGRKPSAVAVDHRLDYMADDGFNNEEEPERP
jgi:hypothetical protein